MLDQRFAYDRFAAVAARGDRERLAGELARELTRTLQASTRPAAKAHECISELKRLGHDLWSFDASDNFQMWCGNWTAPPSVFELIIEMRYSPDEPPSASVTVK